MNSIDTLPASLNSVPDTTASAIPGLEAISDPAALAALLHLLGQPETKTSFVPEQPEDKLPPPAGLLLTDADDAAAAPGLPLEKSPSFPAPPVTLTQPPPVSPETLPLTQNAPLTLPPAPSHLPPAATKTDGETPDSPDQQPASEMSETLGDEILQAFVAQSSSQPLTAAAPAPVSSPSTVDQTARIDAFVNQIVDRILVTDPVSGQNAQVHIKIADHILPGSEIRLWRGEGGQLNVNFATTSPQSAQVLADASQLLAQRLDERLHLSQPVVVTTNIAMASTSDERLHLSQPVVVTGRTEGDGLPQDGRSRQYQSIYELLEAEQQSA